MPKYKTYICHKKPQITVSLDESVLVAFRMAVMENEGARKNPNDLIREFITEYIEEHAKSKEVK